jgi:hypothetical protein
MFGFCIEDSLEPKLSWLQERLDMNDKSLIKVLGYSIEDNLKPKLSWLQEQLDIDDASLTVVVQRLPPLLG